jgi:ABC-type multidrug transport system permease subunit
MFIPVSPLFIGYYISINFEDAKVDDIAIFSAAVFVTLFHLLILIKYINHGNNRNEK